MNLISVRGRRRPDSKVFAIDRNHINGIENFWNQAKRHLAGYNGIPNDHFHLFLKERERRFNYQPLERQA